MIQETKIIKSNEDKWEKMPNHPELYHRTLLSEKEADALKVHVSKILWEKIDVGGAVLPHYHDVAEIIHFIKGKTKVLFNGEWIICNEGETLHVPKGVIHSVYNHDTEPTEQVSIFLPTEDVSFPNQSFETYLIEEELMKEG